MFSRDPIDPPLRCSFCNKSPSTSNQLIAGSSVSICDECVEVCSRIVANRREPPLATEPPGPAQDATTSIVTCALCRMPLPWEEAVAVPERGALCPGCVDAIEAAVGEWREGQA